ncbi:MAG: hypothetical protein KAS66_16325, partial [Candidatus Omnitrophica bacterium]|nr:hypothetical protein [Candidatus Omnitrophota bacterium]
DDYFILATGTASSPVDHDSTLPFEHRRAVFTWPIVGFVTEKTTERANGGRTGKGTSSGGNAAACSMVKLIRSLRAQPKDFVKKAVRVIERRYRIGFRLTRILGELRARIGSTSFIHGPPLLIHSSHEEFHAVDILCSAQDEGDSRVQGSRNFFVSNNFNILGTGSTGSGSIRVPSNQGSGFRAQGSEKTTIPRQPPTRRGQDDTFGDSYLNINGLQLNPPWQVDGTAYSYGPPRNVLSTSTVAGVVYRKLSNAAASNPNFVLEFSGQNSAPIVFVPLQESVKHPGVLENHHKLYPPGIPFGYCFAAASLSRSDFLEESGVSPRLPEFSDEESVVNASSSLVGDAYRVPSIALKGE